MIDHVHWLDDLPIQDLDLLNRLTQYFDTIESRLREGQGWLIFNADRQRSARITNLVISRLSQLRPLISYYLAPWRDFSLNAYMHEVELVARANAEDAAGSDKVQQEYRIAKRVSEDSYYLMLTCDILVLSGVAPQHPHELRYFDLVTEGRQRKRLPTFVVTPRMPHELHKDLHAIDPSDTYWDRIFRRLYRTSLIAL